MGNCKDKKAVIMCLTGAVIAPVTHNCTKLPFKEVDVLALSDINKVPSSGAVVFVIGPQENLERAESSSRYPAEAKFLTLGDFLDLPCMQEKKSAEEQTKNIFNPFSHPLATPATAV